MRRTWSFSKLGSDLIQGFGVGKPLPADELTSWLARRMPSVNAAGLTCAGDQLRASQHGFPSALQRNRRLSRLRTATLCMEYPPQFAHPPGPVYDRYGTGRARLAHAHAHK